MIENETIEDLSIERTLADFLNALSKHTEIDKTKDTVKIALYSRLGFVDTITYRHNDDMIKYSTFHTQKENIRGDPLVVVKNDPEPVYNCRLLSQDHINGIFFFIMKPETELNMEIEDIEEENYETK